MTDRRGYTMRKAMIDFALCRHDIPMRKCAHCCSVRKAHETATTDCDSLRADLARVTAERDEALAEWNTHDTLRMEAEEQRDEAIARAEKAEAEIRQLNASWIDDTMETVRNAESPLVEQRDAAEALLLRRVVATSNSELDGWYGEARTLLRARGLL